LIIVNVVIALIGLLIIAILIKKRKATQNIAPHTNNDYQKFNNQENNAPYSNQVSNSQPAQPQFNYQVYNPKQEINAQPHTKNINNQENSNNENIQNSI